MQNYPPIELRKLSRAERARPGASRAFTLIEIIIAVAILTVILLMAVPSLEGVFADRKLRVSLDGFNRLVRQAQERSVAERRAVLRAAEHPPLHRGGRLHLRRLRSDPQLVHQAEAAQDLAHRRNARNGRTGESNTVDGTSCEVPAGRRNPEELTPPGS